MDISNQMPVLTKKTIIGQARIDHFRDSFRRMAQLLKKTYYMSKDAP